MAVLVCATVAVVIVGGLVQALVRQNRQLRLEQQRLQAIWLAESAAGRAAFQLRQSPDFSGETWHIEGGVATIRVEKIESRSDQRRIVVECIFPDDPVHRVKVSREYLVTVKQSEDQP